MENGVVCEDWAGVVSSEGWIQKILCHKVDLNRTLAHVYLAQWYCVL